MKKRFILLAVLIFFVSLTALSPLLLQHHAIRERISRQLTSTLGEEAQISALKWRWFPIPALQINNLEAKNNLYTIHIPKVLLYPNWRSIFNRKFSLGKITCLSPDIVIRKISRTTEAWPNHLPNLKIAIKHGTLSLPATNLPGGIQINKLQLKDLQLGITSHGQRLKLSLKTQTNFSKKVEFLARVDLSKRYYRLDLNGNSINIAGFFKQLGKDIKPASSNFSAKIHAEGLGLNNWQVSINEINSPCPIYINNKLCKINSITGIKLTKYDKDFFLKLRKFSIADPALSLSGTISLNHNSSGGKPEWGIDLNGEDIDLGAVRKIILERFGNNDIAKEVCGIVLGGHAKSARYTFNGPVTDFQHIHKMKIWVDVDKAPINIPGIDLKLDWASGPITIINGNLRGRKLSAIIDKSQGENGNLFLSLNKENNDFNLDLDINADLHNLKNVLKKIIDDQPFQNELAKFKSIKGRAQGSLHLGDTLHNLKTHVSIKEIDGSGEYTRLPWPFKVTNGDLLIAPHKVSWGNFTGKLGRQTIKQTAGYVTWQTGGQSILNIEHLDADIDLNSLWQKGSLLLNGKHYRIQDYFSQHLAELSGQAQVRNFNLHGPASVLTAWKFEGNADIQNLKFTSRTLPGIIKSKNVQMNINNKSATLAGIFTALNQPLYLNGHYRHHHLNKWHGKTTLNGVVDGRLGKWLKDQNWIPEKFFPKLPCRLKDFSITNNNPSWTDMRLRGNIIAGATGNNTPKLNIDIIHTPNVLINNLTLRHGSQTGKFSYIRNSLQNKTVFSWHGKLEASSLNTILEQNFINSGVISGSFNMLSTHKPNLSSSFNGSLEAKNVAIQSTGTINKLELTGNKHKIKINKLNLHLGADILRGQGSLTTNKDKYHLNLQVATNNLEWQNLWQAIKTVKNKLQPAVKDDIPKKNVHNFLPKNLTGKISFDLGKFTYKKEASETNTDPVQYSWMPLLGDIIFGDEEAKVNLDSGLICGLDMSGVWDLDGTPENSFFQISPKKQTFAFEDTLPCLGVKQSFIEGPFLLDAKLTGLPGNWQSGHINLQSPNGLIRRMDLLSKIFSVINFTDLLVWNNQSASGHKGLAYQKLDIATEIKDNLLRVKKIILKGKGVNLTGRGTVNLKDNNADLTFFIAPLKMIDSVVTSIPLIGKAIGGKKESILTFPVGVKGSLKSPEVTALPASAIGKAALEFVFDTLTLPFRIFSPILPDTNTNKTGEKARHAMPLHD